MFHQTKASKLPVPKSMTEHGRDQRNQMPSPTGIPKPSSTAFSSGGSAGHSGGRGQYWSKISDKFDRGPPLSQRVSYVRSRDSDQNGSPSQRDSRPQNRHFRDEQPRSRGASPRSGIPGPHANQADGAQSSRYDIPCNAGSRGRSRANGDSWVSLELSDTTLHRSDRTDTTIASSPGSNSSISPVSAEDSLTDWEDRFVVNMPSAKDPNPPTMTAQQIAEYQKNIKKVRREGKRIIDPKPRHSSGIGSPARVQQRSPPRDDSIGSIGSFRAYDGGSTQPSSEVNHRPAQVQQDQHAEPQQQQSLRPPNYYSPDEIGKTRISTIWEESPSKQREKRHSASQAADGSFLGCKEINGPETKNPDEILLFGSGEDSASLQPRPLAVCARKRQKEQRKSSGGYSPPRTSGDRGLIQEEWAEVSRNSRNAPCSKRSLVTLCQDPRHSDQEIPRTASQGSEKENSRPIESRSRLTERLEDTRGDDDVFMITPTITRTSIPVVEKRQADQHAPAPRPQGLRRPGDTGQSGTGEAVKAVRAKAQVISTPSELRPAIVPLQPSSTVPSAGLSKVTQHNSIPKPKDTPSSRETNDTTERKTTKDTIPGKSPPRKDRSDPERSTASSSIRGFIRTSGLARSGAIVRSPTDSLATILRNGTESLRSRAESLRNSRKGSPISLPSRDNSESSRSEKSFKSAKESPRATPPPAMQASPKGSPASKLSSVERPPTSRTSSYEKSPSRHAEEKGMPTEQPSTAEKSSPGKLSRAERLEKFKEEARIRRAAKMASENGGNIAGIAELDGHQITGRKNKLQSNITDVNDVCEDLHELNAREKDEHSKEHIHPTALSMVFEIVVVAITNMHRLALQITENPHAKFLASNLLSMLRHCYLIFSQVIRAVMQYQATGSWPQVKDDKAFGRFMVELLQAVIYVLILGFTALIVYRTASYALLAASWFLWLVRPFTWVFNLTTRVLIM